MSNLSWMMSPNNFLWACHGLSLSFYILQDFKRMFSPFKDPCATPRAALSPFTRGAEDGLVCSFLLLNTTSVLFQYLPLPHVVQKVTMSPASRTDPDLRTPVLSNECLVKNKNKQKKRCGSILANEKWEKGCWVSPGKLSSLLRKSQPGNFWSGSDSGDCCYDDKIHRDDRVERWKEPGSWMTLSSFQVCWMHPTSWPPVMRSNDFLNPLRFSVTCSLKCPKCYVGILGLRSSVACLWSPNY